MLSAIRVKSPFSHNALFGFICLIFRIANYDKLKIINELYTQKAINARWQKIFLLSAYARRSGRQAYLALVPIAIGIGSFLDSAYVRHLRHRYSFSARGRTGRQAKKERNAQQSEHGSMPLNFAMESRGLASGVN